MAAYPAYAAAPTEKPADACWLTHPDEKLHFVIAPTTLNKHETYWVLSDDGRYALSCGSNIILWDVALGSPLIVYPGFPGAVRFSEYSPHLVYIKEAGDYWSLRDLYTAEIKGFFRSQEIPPRNEAKLPDSFFKKISAGSAYVDYTDMDVDDSGEKIAIAGIEPMLWDLRQAEPKILVSRKDSLWFNPLIESGGYYTSSKNPRHSIFSQYCNIRCTFSKDGSIYFSQPFDGIHIFDAVGTYKKHVPTEEAITQLRSFHDYIIAELERESPAILRPDAEELQPIMSHAGYELPVRVISEISDEGYFLGFTTKALDNGFSIGQIRMDGSARWSKLFPFPGANSVPIRFILTKSATRFSLLCDYDSEIIMHQLEVNKDNLKYTSVLPHFCVTQRGLQAYSGAFINDSTFVVGTILGKALIGKEDRDDVTNEADNTSPMLNHQGCVIGIEAIDDSKFATVDSYGTVRIFDSRDFELIMTMVCFPESHDYIVYTPDNYYKASKGAVDKIFYAKGLNGFTFRQFDLKYNRPDIILERLGANRDKVMILRSAWEKRLRRMGFDQFTVASADSHAPDLSITNREHISGFSDDGKVIIDITATDDETTIKSIHILMNDVPIFGSAGKDITKTNCYTDSFELSLAEGLNNITVYCINSKGQESLHHQVSVENRLKNQSKTLFVAAVGVSEYADSRYNLEFAASDAVSFASALSEDNRKFDNIRVCVLENEQFDSDSLKKLQDFFNQTGRDDVAILYYAGHGILDESLNYYLGCTASDFNNPEKTSVRYDDFQDILDRIPSIHRFCFVDACHSGDIDKDDYMAINTIPTKEYGELKFRTGVRAVISSKNREIARQYHSMFVDLSHKSGITVVASSNGDELSMESPLYGGGLFTGLLKNALSGECDTDKDGSLTSRELLEYVQHNVSKVSAGRQNPQVKYNDFDKITVLK